MTVEAVASAQTETASADMTAPKTAAKSGDGIGGGSGSAARPRAESAIPVGGKISALRLPYAVACAPVPATVRGHGAATG